MDWCDDCSGARWLPLITPGQTKKKKLTVAAKSPSSQQLLKNHSFLPTLEKFGIAFFSFKHFFDFLMTMSLKGHALQITACSSYGNPSKHFLFMNIELTRALEHSSCILGADALWAGGCGWWTGWTTWVSQEADEGVPAWPPASSNPTVSGRGCGLIIVFI